MAESLVWAVTKSTLENIATITSSYAGQDMKAAFMVRNDLTKIENKLVAISAVLQDAEQKQYSNEAIKIWLRGLKNVVYDINDLLDEVGFDSLKRKISEGHILQQIRYYISSSNPVISHFSWSYKIKNVLQRLDDIASNRRDLGLTDNPVEAHTVKRDPLDAYAYLSDYEIIGRDETKHEIVRCLDAASDGCRLVVLPIVGLGGIGKTALAKLVFNDEWVRNNFDVKLWACVSEEFNLEKTIEEILKSVSNENTKNLGIRQLHEKLLGVVNGKRYFLVLDDVWIENIRVWRELENLIAVGEIGSVILVTTRSNKVASVVGSVDPYNLDRLPSHVCWLIFKHLAFRKGEEEKYPNLVKIGKLTVERSGGVPLVVKVLASLLRNERDEQEWRRITDLSSFIDLDPQYNDITRALQVSYNNLPSYLKMCFAYCSLYVKDSKLNPAILSCLWSALGLLQLRDNNEEMSHIGYRYVTELLSRSLLQDTLIVFTETISHCKMHDLFHDLASSILGQELAVVTMKELSVSAMTKHVVWGYEGGTGISCKVFPKELLRANKVWTFRFGYAMGHISKTFIEGIITNFRCLRILDFHQSNFEELPKSIGNLKHLRYLDLSYNLSLKRLPNTICQLLNLQTLFLPGCEQLEHLPREINKLVNLRHLSATTNQISLASTKLDGLSSLRGLELYGCYVLTSLWDGTTAGLLTFLRELQIVDCPRLTFLPNNMTHLIALETLVIRNCQMLDLEIGNALCGFKSLRTLEITGLPKLVCLPIGIESSATSLRYLWIDDCPGLINLPDWLQHFTSLRRILIYSCPNLVALPEGFRKLNCLQRLLIKNCPHLSKRCAKPMGENYPYISHVPKYNLDDVCLNGADTM